MVIYGAVSTIFLQLAKLHVWWISASIWYMIYIQNRDKQVWKISDVVSGKEGNGG